jgi:hypothetical protein
VAGCSRSCCFGSKGYFVLQFFVLSAWGESVRESLSYLSGSVVAVVVVINGRFNSS